MQREIPASGLPPTQLMVEAMTLQYNWWFEKGVGIISMQLAARLLC